MDIITDDTNPVITKTITINAPAGKIWQALTNPVDMAKWMAETELAINTTWQTGSPIIISGAFYKKPFENKGVVLAFEPERKVAYSHLSSISRLEDVPENYSHITFNLTPANGQTALTVTITRFATDVIYKHLAFYWNVTLEVLRRYVENTNPGS